MNIIKLLLILLLASPSIITSAIAAPSSGAWNLWLVPEKYTINKGEKLWIDVGLTGCGNIDPLKLKITAYSEMDTLMQEYGKEPPEFSVIAIAPSKISPLDRFTKKSEREIDTIILASDYNSGFRRFYLCPKSSGNKKLTLIATFFIEPDGWQTAKSEFDYHVNTWTEKHQTGITLTFIFCGILAIGLFPSIGERIVKRIMRSFENKPNKRSHS
jgi:hypothetical protein